MTNHTSEFNDSLPISVVIVTELLRSDDLQKCLESLAEQKTNFKFEVLILAHGEKPFNLQPWL